MSNESSNFSEPEDCHDLDDAPRFVLAVDELAISLIVVGTLVGNALILILTAKYKRLRRRSFVVGFSVIAADVLFTLSFHVTTIASLAVSRWPFSDLGCTIVAIITQYCIVVRWYIMAVLAIDRFCSVRFPFSYELHSKAIISVLTAVAWILPMFIVTPTAVLSDTLFADNVANCRFQCPDDSTVCRGYSALMWTSSIIIGGLIPTLLYVWLYRQAKKLRNRSTVVLGQVVTQVASGAIVHRPIAPVVNRFGELQGVITFALIFVTYVATGLPAYGLLLIRTLNEDLACRIPIYVTFISIVVFMSSTLLDPLVVMRDRDFRNSLKDFLCSCTRHKRRKVTLRSPEPPALAVELSSNSGCNGSCANGHLDLTLQDTITSLPPGIQP